jgi:hypothetical protein
MIGSRGSHTALRETVGDSAAGLTSNYVTDGLANIMHQQSLLRAELANLDHQQSELITHMGARDHTTPTKSPYSTRNEQPHSPMGGYLLRDLLKFESASYRDSQGQDEERSQEQDHHSQEDQEQMEYASRMDNASQFVDTGSMGGAMDGVYYGGMGMMAQSMNMQSMNMQGMNRQGMNMQGMKMQGMNMQSMNMVQGMGDQQGYGIMRAQLEMGMGQVMGQAIPVFGGGALPQQSYEEEPPMSTATANKLNQINHIMRALSTVQRLKQSLISQQTDPNTRNITDSQLDAGSFEMPPSPSLLDNAQIPRETWMLPAEQTQMKTQMKREDGIIGTASGPFATSTRRPMVQQPAINAASSLRSSPRHPIVVSAAHNFRQRISVKRNHDTCDDDDEDDESSTKRRRRKKSPQQMCMLREVFSVNPKPTKMCIRVIAQNTHLTYQEVSRWFRNERHKSKKVGRGGAGANASVKAPVDASGDENEINADLWEDDEEDGLEQEQETHHGWV